MMSNKSWFKFSPNLVSICFLLMAVLWFGHEMIWQDKVPFFRDLGPYFYPIRFSLAESFKVGEFPLWDRHMAMGFPLLADFQSAPFYPPHLLFFFSPFFAVVRILFLFHYLVAAIGCYVLWRHWGFPVYLSLVSAILFTFGGVIISLTNVLNHFQTAVWLPWLILAGERAVGSNSGKAFLVLTAVALIQFLAGSPEFYAMSIGVLIIAAMKAAAEQRAPSCFKALLVIAAANTLVIAMSMIQLLPTLELFIESRRSSHISAQEATAWSLPPISLINFFFLDKDVDTRQFNGLRLLFIRDLPFFISLYIGQISLFGLYAWLYTSHRKEKLVLLAVIFLGLAMALGRYTPLYPLLHSYVPFFRMFRFPEKFLFLVYPLLIWITLRGVHSFVESNRQSQKKPLLLLTATLTLLVLAYLLGRFWREDFFTFLHWSNLVSDPSIVAVLPSLLFSLERQILVLGAMLLLLFLYRQEKIGPPLWRFLIVGFVLVDLGAVHRHYQFLVDPSLVTEKTRIISRPEAEPYRIFSSLPNLHPSVFTFRERPFAEVTGSVWSSLVPNTGIFYGFDYMQEIDALGRAPYDFFLQAAQKLPPARFYPLLAALNIKYISSFSPLPEGEIALVRHFPDYPLWLYRVKQPVPRVYVAGATEHETDPGRTLDRLASKDFDPFIDVVLDQPLPFAHNNGFRAEARIEEYKSQAVTIQASLEQTGVLVLADSFYPGWNAYVNGAQEKIYRANLFFRAVPLPPGDHTIEFRYEPTSFRIGFLVSLVTFAGVIGTTVICILRRCKQKHPHPGFLKSQTDTNGTPATVTER